MLTCGQPKPRLFTKQNQTKMSQKLKKKQQTQEIINVPEGNPVMDSQNKYYTKYIE